MYKIISYLFGEKKTHRTIEQTIRDSFPVVANKIITLSPDFDTIQELLTQSINQDLDTEGFSYDYMKLVTLSFVTYLKVIHKEPDQQTKITVYLNELLTNIMVTS